MSVRAVLDTAAFGLSAPRRAPAAFTVLCLVASVLAIMLMHHAAPVIAAALTGAAPLTIAHTAVDALGSAWVDLGAAAVFFLLAHGAIGRALVRAGRGGWIAGFALGPDEARLFVLGVVHRLVAALPLTVIGGALAALWTVNHAAPAPVANILILGAATASAVLAYLLSTQSAVALGERGVHLKPGLRLAVSHAARALTAYALVFGGLGLAIAGLSGVLALIAGAAPGWFGLTTLTDAPPGEGVVSVLLSPLGLAITAAGASVWTLAMAARLGVAASLYRVFGERYGLAGAVHPDMEALAHTEPALHGERA